MQICCYAYQQRIQAGIEILARRKRTLEIVVVTTLNKMVSLHSVASPAVQAEIQRVGLELAQVTGVLTATVALVGPRQKMVAQKPRKDVQPRPSESVQVQGSGLLKLLLVESITSTSRSFSRCRAEFPMTFRADAMGSVGSLARMKRASQSSMFQSFSSLSRTMQGKSFCAFLYCIAAMAHQC